MCLPLAAAAIVVAGAEGLETGRARRREKDWDNDGSTVSAIAPVWSSSAPRFSLSKMPLIAASIIAPYKEVARIVRWCGRTASRPATSAAREGPSARS